MNYLQKIIGIKTHSVQCSSGVSFFFYLFEVSLLMLEESVFASPLTLVSNKSNNSNRVVSNYV